MIIRSLAADDLEALAVLTDPKLRNELEEARADVTAGRVSGPDKLIAKGQAKL